jgi:hypothetical protein
MINCCIFERPTIGLFFMSLRFQTYFGVHIPPFKEEKLGAGSTTIRFVLTGRVPSKKNHQQAVTIRKDARNWANKTAKLRQPTWADVHRAISMCKSKMRGNVEYQEFLARVKPILVEQRNEWQKRLADKGLIFPIPKAAMSLRLYFKDKYVTDTINKQQTIQDVLIDSLIIANDDYKSLNPIHSASACYYEELIYNIAFVSLSFKLPKDVGEVLPTL